MDFRDYVVALQKFIRTSQPDIVLKLFDAAGSIETPNEDTAKSWLKPKTSNGYRKCKTKTYFPSDEMHDDDFIKFIKKWVNTSWKELQMAFRQLNCDKIVDVATDDENRFYRSLLNQFQKILGLPLSDFPSDNLFDNVTSRDISEKNKSVEQPTKESQQSLSPESIYSNFISAVKGFPIEKFLNNDQIASLPDYLIWDAITFWGSINASREADNAPGGTTDGYQRIIEFIDALKIYLDFLKEKSVKRDVFPDDFHLISNDGVESKANTYRKRAKDLFKAAYLAAEIEQEQDRKQESERLILDGEKTPPHPGEYLQPSDLKG